MHGLVPGLSQESQRMLRGLRRAESHTGKWYRVNLLLRAAQEGTRRYKGIL